MTDTLKVPLFDAAQLAGDDISRIRRDLTTPAAPGLRRLTPWAFGFVLLGLAGMALVRRLART